MYRIKINGLGFVSSEKRGRQSFLTLEDGSVIPKKQISIIECLCVTCKQYRQIKSLNWYSTSRDTECEICKVSGEKNPFYGKTHSNESKDKISKANTGRLVGDKNPWFGKHLPQETRDKLSKALKGKFAGENNPFYGKKHSEEVIKRIVENNKRAKDNWSDEQREDFSRKMKESQQRQKDRDIDYYREIKSRGGKATALSRDYSMNKIETIVHNKLIEIGLDFKFSVILGFYQYDFGNKEYRTLLEVQGDYWHGNPNLYTTLNWTQTKRVARDKEKLEFANKHDMKIFYIWEQDIKNNNFEVLYEIERYINDIKADRDRRDNEN